MMKSAQERCDVRKIGVSCR